VAEVAPGSRRGSEFNEAEKTLFVFEHRPPFPISLAISAAPAQRESI